MYRYDEFDHTIVAERVAQFRDQVGRRLSGEMTEDEFFVTQQAAAAGVTITNLSSTEPLVILKHFNPGNPGMPRRS